MRIIAGKNRGRKLVTLEGLATRPTLDGTKEAIFSSLGGMLPDYTVLDIFGGSGALSLESISRGAKKAYILDNNLDAIEIIKKNAQALNSMKELTILYGDYKQIIGRFKNSKMFDIVFIDPPFKLKVIDELIEYIIEYDFLADDYPIDQADIVIMNPPYSILEPFMIRALEIAKDKLIVLGRT